VLAPQPPQPFLTRLFVRFTDGMAEKRAREKKVIMQKVAGCKLKAALAVYAWTTRGQN
jgi:hypothetical protein